MAKTLFVSWADGSSSKFTVSDEFTLPEPETMIDQRMLLARQLPFEGEMMLALSFVRSMYVLDEDKLEQANEEPQLLGQIVEVETLSDEPPTLGTTD